MHIWKVYAWPFVFIRILHFTGVKNQEKVISMTYYQNDLHLTTGANKNYLFMSDYCTMDLGTAVYCSGVSFLGPQISSGRVGRPLAF